MARPHIRLCSVAVSFSGCTTHPPRSAPPGAAYLRAAQLDASVTSRAASDHLAHWAPAGLLCPLADVCQAPFQALHFRCETALLAPLTLEQVGQIVGLTKERVRQIQNKALEKIRKTLEQNYIDGTIEADPKEVEKSLKK